MAWRRVFGLDWPRVPCVRVRMPDSDLWSIVVQGGGQASRHRGLCSRLCVLRMDKRLTGCLVTGPQEGEEITVEIQNRYNTYRFDGKKSVVLSTASWMGGANDTGEWEPE